MTSQEIRKKFLDFFKSNQHKIVPSAPIVLKDDPTLMFTNSGMNQFKDFFLGYQKTDNLRIADTQKCLRVSGKHNDLDDVGKDTYHHTMFEMLGNWSFGDYFKEDSIKWAWQLLTEVYKIPKEWIYVTVFEGDKSENLERDNEAYNFWKQYISEDRILNGNKKDNFWEMGATGPCGPCSEIHVDIRSEQEKKLIDGKSLVNNDHPQVVEIWNLVFMEFLRKDDGSLEKLPNQNIDTGMGFERLCMVLQGKQSNYDTDIFMPLINKVEQITHKKYGENEKIDIAIRVVVDHIRAVAFAIADGQIPSNSGAGYVIRRILRRAISYGFRFLNQKNPFLFELVQILVNQMKEFFPEILKNQKLVTEVIKEEENNFLRTIDKGLVRLENIFQTQKDKIVNGKLVYELHDTYGFPSDLSRIIAEEKGFSIDEIGYEQEKERIKNISKQASNSKTFDWIILNENINVDFVGYDKIQEDINITRYRKVENKDGIFYHLVFDKTPFYAESGGQIGDSGTIESINEKIEIIDTKKENNLIIHVSNQIPESFTTFIAKVNQEKRNDIQRNHSATHLLHQALRQVLGNHVEQKGSFVSDEYLRFDFSHFSKMNPEEIQEVCTKVNDKIKQNIQLQEYRDLPFNQAIEKGAMALFGEKYGNNVRMIQFDSSLELCGGTHVKNTSDIFMFELISESSIASGVRRIEALTGNKAYLNLKKYQTEIENISQELKSKDVFKSIQKLQSENEGLKKQIEILKLEKAKQEKQNWKSQIILAENISKIIVKTDLEPALIKDLIFQLKSEINNLFIVIVSVSNEKPLISVGISDDLIKEKELNATNIVKELAKEIKGSGGGQASFATAGGKDVNGVDLVINKGKSII